MNSNQGFIDLMNPAGIAAIIAGILLLFGFIVAGAAYVKVVQREDKRKRAILREMLEQEKAKNP